MSWQDVALFALVLTGAPIVWRTVRGALRRRFAADLVATLSIVTAVILRQPVAGLVIVAMQTGGELRRDGVRRTASSCRWWASCCRRRSTWR